MGDSIKAKIYGQETMKNTKRHFSFIFYKFLCMLFEILVLSSCFDNPDTYYWAKQTTGHKTSVPELWSLGNIFINQGNVTKLIAITGKVVFIGSNKQDSYPRVIAIDEVTGGEAWEYASQNPVAIAAANKNVYIGEVGSVTALNSESGNVLWSTPLPFAKSITKLVIQDNVIYVDTVGANYYFLDTDTGVVLQSISYTVNNNMNPNIPSWSNHQMDLELSDNALYFQKQTGIYPNGDAVEITAMDKLRNKIWSASVPAISRMSVNSSGVYVLTLGGTLVRLNLSDGLANNLVEFTPPPILSSTLENGDVVGYGYYVAANEKILYVYLGDGAQLFAYRLPNTP